MLRRPGRLHPARRRGRDGSSATGRGTLARWPPRSPGPGPAGQDDRRRRDVRLPEPEPLVEAALALVEAVERGGAAGLRAGIACGPAIAARRRLLRPRGQPRQPRHRDRPAGQRALHRGGPRRGRRASSTGRSPAGTGSRGSPSGAAVPRRGRRGADRDVRELEARGSGDREQVDDEDERRVGRDRRRLPGLP